MADELAVFAERRVADEQWNQRLASLPIQDVIGLVDMSGAGGGNSKGDDFWTLHFSFAAWRLNDSPLQTRKLTVRRRVTHEELRTYMDAIKPDTIIRIRVRGPVEAGSDHDALLESIVGAVESDAELNAYADELRKPVTFTDAVLGTFTLDRGVNWFTGKTQWSGRSIRLNLDPDSDEQDAIEQALRTAHELWRAQSQWNQRIQD